MYDIKPLEKEWKQYKAKQRRPWYFMFFAFVFLLLSSYILLNSNLLRQTNNMIKVVDDDKAMDSDKPVEKKTKLPKMIINNALMDIQIREKHNTMNIVLSNANPTSSKPIPMVTNNSAPDIPILNKMDIEISEPVIRQRVHLDIFESDTSRAYRDVEKRFSSSRDVDDALFLAKYYYGKDDYKKAEYWALEVNKIDETLEDGLFIFIKAKYKQGHKNEAISILMAYLKKTNSQEAKKLLYTIKKNKL